MRWLSFIVVSTLALSLQATVAPRISLGNSRPDWILVSLAFYAMHAPAMSIVVAAWAVGTAADLMTVEELGLLSATYTLAVALIVSVREYFFVRRLLAQGTLTLFVAVLVQFTWLIYRRTMYETGLPFMSDGIQSLLAGFYTAVWAPPFYLVMRLFQRSFGDPLQVTPIRSTP